MLSVLLLGQFTFLYGVDQLTVPSEDHASESGTYSFYEHLVIHNPSNYGIHYYQLYEGTQGSPPRKDPFIAGLLSWFMMGVGQIYVQEYWKGSLFIAASLTNKVLLLLLISHINSKYGSSEEIVNVDWASFDTSTKFLIIAYLVESLGLRIFSVVDAVNSANKYNERYDTSSPEQGFTFDLEGGDVSMGYYYRFND